MSLVNRSIDPFIYVLVGVSLFVVLVVLILIPAQEARNLKFNEEQEIVLNADCDQLKKIIIESIEEKNDFYIPNIAKAKALHEWKCEK